MTMPPIGQIVTSDPLAQPQQPVQQPVAQAPDPVVVESHYEDYFGFGEQLSYTLPDGKQQIFFKVMNEGEKVRYEKSVNRDIHLNRQTQDARISQDAAGERHALILASVTGWSLVKKDGAGNFVPAQYDNNTLGGQLNQWLNRTNPQIVEKLADAIRDANPWTKGEMTIEDVDKEMARLSDVRAELVKEQEKKESFQK